MDEGFASHPKTLCQEMRDACDDIS
jgi:hypothetical protein